MLSTSRFVLAHGGSRFLAVSAVGDQAPPYLASSCPVLLLILSSSTGRFRVSHQVRCSSVHPACTSPTDARTSWLVAASAAAPTVPHSTPVSPPTCPPTHPPLTHPSPTCVPTQPISLPSTPLLFTHQTAIHPSSVPTDQLIHPSTWPLTHPPTHSTRIQPNIPLSICLSN